MGKKVRLSGEANEKQSQFFLSEAKYTAYGGARGGGKSWALRRKIVYLALRYKEIKILVIRRTYPELQGNHIQPLQTELIPLEICSYSESKKCFYFRNGSIIKMGYCDSESDVLQYQGQEYDVIAIDEATQLTEYQFNIIKTALRGANKQPKRMYLTCNPGGVGHAWVRRLFIDREFRDGENAGDYKFIPASVYDNKVLLKYNPDYLTQLESLPPNLKEAWLYGKWNVFAGQYFTEFDYNIHTVPPKPPAEKASKYCVIDYGLDMFAALFIALDGEDNAYVYHEIYESDLIVSEAAKRLIAAGVNKTKTVIAPSDLWNRQKDSGKSISDLFAEQGVYLTRLSSGRVEGWLALKEWLKPLTGESDGNIIRYSKMTISRACVNLIKCLPLLAHDTVDFTDVSTQPHDITHAPDALRYFSVYNSIGYREKRAYSDKRIPLKGINILDTSRNKQGDY